MQWDELRGSGVRERFCEQCRLTVVNYSALRPEARERLTARARTERVCIAYRDFLAQGADEPVAIGTRGGMNSGVLLKLGGAAAFLAAVGTLASQAVRDPRAGDHAWEAAQDAYYSAKYRAEEWIEEVRVFFGGTPTYTYALGDFSCGPVTPPAPAALVPAPGPATSPALPESPPREGEP
jgi:hypothetical protein